MLLHLRALRLATTYDAKIQKRLNAWFIEIKKTLKRIQDGGQMWDPRLLNITKDLDLVKGMALPTCVKYIVNALLTLKKWLDLVLEDTPSRAGAENIWHLFVQNNERYWVSNTSRLKPEQGYDVGFDERNEDAHTDLSNDEPDELQAPRMPPNISKLAKETTTAYEQDRRQHEPRAPIFSRGHPSKKHGSMLGSAVPFRP
jgi:hypothetical protein